MMRQISLLSFSGLNMAYAGCPAMGVQDVNVIIQTCEDKTNPNGSVIELVVDKQVGQSLGMNVKAKEKLSVFLFEREKLECKKIKLNQTYCVSLQKWCIMAGNPPHGKNTTLYNLKSGACTPNAHPPRIEPSSVNANPKKNE